MIKLTPIKKTLKDYVLLVKFICLRYFNYITLFGYTNTTNVGTGGALDTANLYLASLNIGGGSLFSSREQAFASIGFSLTNSEATTFYNLVQAFQTSLSRQV